MGLDMYLNKSTYLMGHKVKPIKVEVEDWEGNVKTQEFESPKEIIEDFGYWRKANHIHKWFVDNCQDGEDECERTEVSIKQLQELLDICKKILANPELAKDLLPTQEGFFFGGTEYDDCYFKTIKDTVEILSKIKFEEPWVSYYYQSSW